jgi:hypothetical protein
MLKILSYRLGTLFNQGILSCLLFISPPLYIGLRYPFPILAMLKEPRKYNELLHFES